MRPQLPETECTANNLLTCVFVIYSTAVNIYDTVYKLLGGNPLLLPGMLPSTLGPFDGVQ